MFGERDIKLVKRKNGITVKMITLVILSLVISGIFFSLSWFVSSDYLSYHFASTSYIYDAETDDMASLQKYVSENNIAAPVKHLCSLNLTAGKRSIRRQKKQSTGKCFVKLINRDSFQILRRIPNHNMRLCNFEDHNKMRQSFLCQDICNCRKCIATSKTISIYSNRRAVSRIMLFCKSTLQQEFQTKSAKFQLSF